MTELGVTEVPESKAVPFKKLSFWHPATLLGTWFGAGLSPWMPGTVGSAAAMPFAWIIAQYFGGIGLLIATCICFFVGWWACEIYCRETGKSDPKEMVIDEVAGMWLLISGLTLWAGESGRTVFEYSESGSAIEYFLSGRTFLIMLGYVIIFFVFRVFDVWKPWPVSWADRTIKGGLGVMLDDILAALYSVIPALGLFIYLVSQGALS